jgi:hypothetical protein
MIKYSYNQKLGIASAESNVRVLTILQRPGTRQPSISSYLGAAYSRSKVSVLDLAESVASNNTDADAKMENIFYNYGHSSVAAMANLSICIENVSMWFAFRLFNFFSLGAGQEKSSRYVKINSSDEDEATKYLFHHYERLYQPTYEALASHYETNDKKVLNARTLDCVRALLPINARTSLYYVTDAGSWSSFISYLLTGSDEDKLIARLILDLLTGCKELTELGFIAEAPGLIRHTKPCVEQKRAIDNIIAKVSDIRSYKYIDTSPCLRTKSNAIENFYITGDPDRYIMSEPSEVVNYVRSQLKVFDKNHLLPIQCRYTSPFFEGVTDIGSLRDLNRHRSLWRYIPQLHQDKMNKSHGYSLPLYLKVIPEVEEQYNNVLTNYYKKYDSDVVPLAHNLRYRIGGTIDKLLYTCQLRTRPGGHINYRALTHYWAHLLEKEYNFINPDTITRVSLDRSEFLDRS